MEAKTICAIESSNFVLLWHSPRKILLSKFAQTTTKLFPPHKLTYRADEFFVYFALIIIKSENSTSENLQRIGESCKQRIFLWRNVQMWFYKRTSARFSETLHFVFFSGCEISHYPMSTLLSQKYCHLPLTTVEWQSQMRPIIYFSHLLFSLGACYSPELRMQ